MSRSDGARKSRKAFSRNRRAALFADEAQRLAAMQREGVPLTRGDLLVILDGVYRKGYQAGYQAAVRAASDGTVMGWDAWDDDDLDL